jgi:uncharacterized membrane protein YbhN (UPF0104 family)
MDNPGATMDRLAWARHCDEIAADNGSAESAALTSREAGKFALLGWLIGLMLLAALVLVALRASELEKFIDLLRRARPQWLAAGLAMQAATYVLAALVLRHALERFGVRQRLTKLIPLGLAKLFTDQAVPSVGLSGALIAVRSLGRRGVPRAATVGAMLLGLLGYYVAYGAIVIFSLGILWRRGEMTRSLLTAASIFAVAISAAPVVLLLLRGWTARRLPAWVKRLPPMRELVSALAEARIEGCHEIGVVSRLAGLHVLVFMLDAATLGAALAAFGTPASPDIVLSCFVMASVAATLSWLPGGLGSFEAACVAMLHIHGVNVESALAATLLLRGMTFWLPMAPGLWLAHREVGAFFTTDRAAAAIEEMSMPLHAGDVNNRRLENSTTTTYRTVMPESVNAKVAGKDSNPSAEENGA